MRTPPVAVCCGISMWFLFHNVEVSMWWLIAALLWLEWWDGRKYHAF